MFLFTGLSSEPASDSKPNLAGNDVTVHFPGYRASDLKEFSITFNPISESIYILSNQTGELRKVSLKGGISIVDTLSFPASKDFHRMESSHDGAALFFWEIGLGEVYRYNLSSNSLENISNTSVKKLMFYHGSVLDEENRIFAQGGYGFWEFKKMLLKFNSKNEWLLESKANELDVNATGNKHLLWLDKRSKELYYMTPATDKWIDQTHYLLATYLVEDQKWTSKKKFAAKEGSLPFGYYSLASGTYTRNDSSNISHLSGRFFINTQSAEIFRITLPFSSQYMPHVFFYSEKSDTWIMVGYDREISIINLRINRIPNSELLLSEVPTRTHFELLIFSNLWLFGVVIFIGVLAVFLYFKHLEKPTTEVTEESTSFQLREENGTILVYKNNTLLPFTDDHVRKTWEVIFSMKKKGKSAIPMSEFDDQIFLPDNSPPFRSKTKKVIFQYINSLSEQPLIYTKPNPIDKRYKDINIDLDQLEITD